MQRIKKRLRSTLNLMEREVNLIPDDWDEAEPLQIDTTRNQRRSSRLENGKKMTITNNECILSNTFWYLFYFLLFNNLFEFGLEGFFLHLITSILSFNLHFHFLLFR